MPRPKFEVAQIADRFGQQFVKQCQPNSFMVRTLDALQKCRTSALGGHIDYCDCCGEQRISYNSCGNRHCPKCQGAKQALWVEDRMNDTLDCKILPYSLYCSRRIKPDMFTGAATCFIKPSSSVYGMCCNNLDIRNMV